MTYKIFFVLVLVLEIRAKIKNEDENEKEDDEHKVACNGIFESVQNAALQNHL